MAKAKYEDDFPLRAQDYARRGLIDKEIAKKLGISERSYYEYQKRYPQFSQAIKKGKKPVDIEVENALLKRAMGYRYMETQTEYEPGQEGRKAKVKSVRKTTKIVIPDVTAQIFWVKNRRPALWKDKHDLAVSGGLTINVISAVPRPKPKEESDAETKKE